MFRIERITQTSTHLKGYFEQTRLKVKSRTGLDDIDCFLALDSTGCYVGVLDGKPIGTLCVFKHEGGYRHIGAYFIEQEYRKQGYGLKLFQEVLKRSEPFTNVSSYATMDIVELYKRYFGSVESLHPVEVHVFNLITALKNLQQVKMDASYRVKDMSDVGFKALCEYDEFVFGYDRQRFLYKWLHSQASHSSVVVNDDRAIIGYAVAREMGISLDGYRIGPLFCEDISVAKALLQSVLEKVKVQGRIMSNSMQICVPVGRNAQVHELLKFLDGTCIHKVVFNTTNGHPNGHFGKWFAVTNMICG